MNRSPSREEESCSRNVQKFMEFKDSLPFLQELTTGPILDTDKFSPHPPIVFI
jgi:hypothetical protein